jgi:prepilin-type N-terminal cleavage/methylation domain-containing protein/prepilin-type processing-associated H-X9-DG protein
MRTNRFVGASRCRAFTLIELLVVVAIIALLISILLPSLVRAKEQGKSAVCKANEHMMGLALAMYAMEEKYYPGVWWNRSLPTFLPMVQDIGSGLASANWPVLWPYRLLKYAKRQPGIFNCPSAPPDTRWDGKRWIVSAIKPNLPATLQGTLAYGYNDWGISDSYRAPDGLGLGLGAYVSSDKKQNRGQEMPADRVKRPAEMVAIVDANSDGVFDAVFDPTPRDSYNVNGDEGPGKRHNKGSNAVFCDGHAEGFRQRDLCAYLDEYESTTRKFKNPKARMFNRDNKPHFDDFPP